LVLDRSGYILFVFFFARHSHITADRASFVRLHAYISELYFGYYAGIIVRRVDKIHKCQRDNKRLATSW